MFFKICFVSIVGAQANGLPPKQLTSWNCFTLCFFLFWLFWHMIWTLYSRVDAYWYFWRYKIDKFRRSFTQSGPNWSRPKLGRSRVRNKTMPSKVPPNYFIYPEFLAILVFPIVWGLLPITGFQPDLLASYLPPDIFQSILKAQVNIIDSYICLKLVN